jgi:hypothetical protein
LDYTLMHKSIPVVDMLIDETGYIAKLGGKHDIRHLPPGVNLYKTGIDRKALNDWWTGRSIPASRAGIGEALQSIGVSTPSLLIEKCFGLSLSDQYWICPKGSGLRWENVNFFHNDFSKDMGEVLFGYEPNDPVGVNLMSPDNTSDGWLRKKWIISDGKRLLMKGGSGVYQQEPLNEVIASAIMRRLNIAHVSYSLTFDGDKPYSLCESFVTPDTELVPAWRVLQTRKQPNDRSLRDHFLDCCDALGAPNVQDALWRLLTVDYIIANEDRHWNNFGLLRNAETLEWLGLAPVYDSGTSLWYNTQRVGSLVECKPFRKTHAEQIKLVEDLTWFDSRPLQGLDDEIRNILSRSEDVDERRRTAIASAVMERCGQIEKLVSIKPSLLKSLHEKQRHAEVPRNAQGKKQESEIT